MKISVPKIGMPLKHYYRSPGILMIGDTPHSPRSLNYSRNTSTRALAALNQFNTHGCSITIPTAS
jgi:hypothetical protein